MRKHHLGLLALMLHVPRLAQTGTYSLADLRANTALGDQRLNVFGVPNALALANALTTEYNARVTQSLLALADTTTDRYGSETVGGGIRMERISEYTNVRTQKGGKTQGRGFPLHAFNVATGWTEHFEAITTVAAFVGMLEAVQVANDQMTRDQIMVALFDPEDRDIEEDILQGDSFVRAIMEGAQVKPLYNADGEIVTDSNGVRINGDHSHYLGANGLSNEALDALIQTVAEHSRGNRIVVNISEADVSTVMGLPGFIPARFENVTPGAMTPTTTFTMNLADSGNRQIGVLKSGHLVQTREWVPAGYAVAWNLGAQVGKVLRVRVPKEPVFRGLRLRGQEGNTVLRARTWENQQGVGVSNRGGAAILKFNAPDGQYAPPAALDEIAI